jgi:hypothetical protein
MPDPEARVSDHRRAGWIMTRADWIQTQENCFRHSAALAKRNAYWIKAGTALAKRNADWIKAGTAQPGQRRSCIGCRHFFPAYEGRK